MNVKTLCLGALSLGDRTGYDIKKLFEAAFSHFHSASYGSIYPALAQLEADGLVSCRTEQGSRHPDRKIYQLTPAGSSALLRELMTEPPAERFRSEFMVLMFFAHLLPTERLSQILAEVQERYAGAVGYLESILDAPQHTPGTRFTVEAGLTYYRAMLDFLARRGPELLQAHASGGPAPTA